MEQVWNVPKRRVESMYLIYFWKNYAESWKEERSLTNSDSLKSLKMVRNNSI